VVIKFLLRLRAMSEQFGRSKVPLKFTAFDRAVEVPYDRESPEGDGDQGGYQWRSDPFFGWWVDWERPNEWAARGTYQVGFTGARPGCAIFDCGMGPTLEEAVKDFEGNVRITLGTLALLGAIP
jgi:hypothetical protein